VRTLSASELNRTLLLRQLLLERTRLPAARVVGRLVALQAQYSPSPYVALWSRVQGFEKQALTGALARGSVVKAGVLRGTLHVLTRELYPLLEAAHIESQSGRIRGLGVDPVALAAAWPDRALDANEARAFAGRVLGTDDRWVIEFTLRAMPFVRTAPTGAWPHNVPSPTLLWREPLASPEAGAVRVVRDYLAAYGPASREDIKQFTAFRLGQIDLGLDGLRTFEDEHGGLLHDIARGPIAPARVPAPVRFLPPFDSSILAHRDRTRILPDAYRETVIRKVNGTMLATYTVDGLIAGWWRTEKTRGRLAVVTEAFEPLPLQARREVDDEAARLAAFYAA
jgi:Winged helix DNA-binding domain